MLGGIGEIASLSGGLGRHRHGRGPRAGGWWYGGPQVIYDSSPYYPAGLPIPGPCPPGYFFNSQTLACEPISNPNAALQQPLAVEF